jgi:hypothetical protein
MERGRNIGGDTDLFYAGKGDHYLGPSGTSIGAYPNADSYKRGNIVKNDVEIHDISLSGDTITFSFTDGSVPITDMPSVSAVLTLLPSSTPSLRPSFSNTPTLFHSSVPTPFPSSRPSLRPTTMPEALAQPKCKKKNKKCKKHKDCCNNRQCRNKRCK